MANFDIARGSVGGEAEEEKEKMATDGFAFMKARARQESLIAAA